VLVGLLKLILIKWHRIIPDDFLEKSLWFFESELRFAITINAYYDDDEIVVPAEYLVILTT
jgi:hypothetical protein